ncbi:MAG: hypothetical protein IKJ34_04190 [Mailhella sp.]|nr:hypothetical protein [Mailhella sp.]
MSTNIELPGWLEACRPGDDLYADAYEGSPAELRALLKTAIAFAFHRWPGMEGEQLREYRSSRSGFRHVEKCEPAAWALVVLGSGFASPARLLAALVPAIIAGVGRIVIVSEAPFAQAICTAMELAGLEESFVLDSEQIHRLWSELRALSPEGRLLTFPDSEGSLSSAQKALLHEAATLGMPRLRDFPAPTVLSQHGSGSETEARLRWLHPDARIVHSSSDDIRVAFLSDEHSDPLSTSPGIFCCGPGMEACWPGPSPEFYLTCSCSAFLLQETNP